MSEKFGFFANNRHYNVHREGELVIVTFGDQEIIAFAYGTEKTPLQQAAQWKIERKDPLEYADVIDLEDMRNMRKENVDADDS